jgi:ABC-2 type transport system ATP-binding protein
MPALSIRSLRKSFLVGPPGSVQRTEALIGVDLDVREGEILGIVGNESAGKTTLLLCAAGLLRRDAGSLYWFGRRFNGGGCFPGLAYVSTVPAYYPFLTVRDVLDYYSGGEDIPARRRPRTIESAAARLCLTDHLATPVSRLGGEVLKRVGIAQALVEEPRVILLDATLDGLGAGATAAHRALRHAATHGVTVIATSRNASILAPVATRILVMDGGRVTATFSAERYGLQSFGGDSVFADPPIQVRHIAERVH